MPQTLAEQGGGAPAAAAGQLWDTYETGGYLSSQNLSQTLRFHVSARVRFRQFCEMPEPTQAAKNKGEVFHWNNYGNIDDAAGGLIDERTNALDSARVLISQGSCVVDQYGLEVPLTSKLQDLGEQPIKEILRKQLERHCARKLDKLAYDQWAATPLKATPAAGNDPDAIDLAENGTAPNANAYALTKRHVRRLAKIASERDIPTFPHGDYHMLARPMTYEPLEAELEGVSQYTETGYGSVIEGEKGRFAGVRFVEQTNIDDQGWASGLSDEAFFFGEDCVAECVVIPEEIRGKIPQNYGLDHGLAWYYLGGFALTRVEATDTRVIHWTSTS